ncbi:MAG: hypothetical protein QOI47_261, partial [Actinomycetota bacterium]|nr:hypothetical protein [Actinomycetota bacterium]
MLPDGVPLAFSASLPDSCGGFPAENVLNRLGDVSLAPDDVVPDEVIDLPALPSSRAVAVKAALDGPR